LLGNSERLLLGRHRACQSSIRTLADPASKSVHVDAAIAEEALMSDWPKFTPGDRVEVVNGAFAGMRGTVASPAAGNGRYHGHRGHTQVERGLAYLVWLRVYGRETLIRFLPNQLRLTEGTA
jgi:hypothetical protein